MSAPMSTPHIASLAHVVMAYGYLVVYLGEKMGAFANIHGSMLRRVGCRVCFCQQFRGYEVIYSQ